MSELLHPELVNNVPFVGRRIIRTLSKLADSSEASRETEDNVSVVVRTLNEAEKLESLLHDINAQKFQKEIEVIVVDNESTDHTTDVAFEYGANVVRIDRGDFTYPKSMNIGIDAASFDIVWLTVGHALPATDQLLRAGVLRFNNSNIAGVYGEPLLPSVNASRTERLIGVVADNRLKLGNRQETQAKLGTMAATSAMIRKAAWDELGHFDERYEVGGEDTALARLMLKAGYSLESEPLLSVHHSHQLGPIGSLRQLRRWLRTVKGPVSLDRENIADLRPHLDFS